MSAGLSVGLGVVLGKVMLQLQYKQVLMEDALLANNLDGPADMGLLKYTLTAVGLRQNS